MGCILRRNVRLCNSSKCHSSSNATDVRYSGGLRELSLLFCALGGGVTMETQNTSTRSPQKGARLVQTIQRFVRDWVLPGRPNRPIPATPGRQTAQLFNRNRLLAARLTSFRFKRKKNIKLQWGGVNSNRFPFQLGRLCDTLFSIWNAKRRWPKWRMQ